LYSEDAGRPLPSIGVAIPTLAIIANAFRVTPTEG
jgi:hypothetical protein